MQSDKTSIDTEDTNFSIQSVDLSASGGQVGGFTPTPENYGYLGGGGLSYQPDFIPDFPTERPSPIPAPNDIGGANYDVEKDVWSGIDQYGRVGSDYIRGNTAPYDPIVLPINSPQGVFDMNAQIQSANTNGFTYYDDHQSSENSVPETPANESSSSSGESSSYAARQNSLAVVPQAAPSEPATPSASQSSGSSSLPDLGYWQNLLSGFLKKNPSAIKRTTQQPAYFFSPAVASDAVDNSKLIIVLIVALVAGGGYLAYKKWVK